MAEKHTLESCAVVEGFGEFTSPEASGSSSRFEVLGREGNLFRIRMNDRHYSASVLSFDGEKKLAIINIGGSVYHVRLVEPLDRLIDEMGFLRAAKHSVKEIRSPMPGLVVEIFVIPGQLVAEGDRLFSLEAMKMENIVKSPGEGVVQDVFVKKGAAVDKGQLIIMFEE
ncbi:MAG: acetyl-CoA carboxylase biotin carboxyl carrier protein subunit [Saprospiraceae bacterium]|jgi:acetyl/propionyl-CoA carboxylase alpha subunit|nr:acetyl-CoA carboxylase biotin carboxyl carrier protein subunit [Saprospiraceae bacterium]